MKKHVVLLLLALLSLNGFSQTTSDLYKKVDLILRGGLGFNIDSARLANHDTKSKRLKIRDSENPQAIPVILFNGKFIEVQKLNDYQLSSIKTIKVVKRNDPQAKALFGSRGALGAIFISSKTYKDK